MKYQTEILSKPEVQRMIKSLRSSGLKVNKIDSGYICKAISPEQKDPIAAFYNMEGRSEYLVIKQQL